jgi:hypothetical protein
MTLKVFVPMDPVEPRMAIPFNDNSKGKRAIDLEGFGEPRSQMIRAKRLSEFGFGMNLVKVYFS